MDERLARQARNEGLTRTVNERVATLDARAGSWAAAEQMFDFHCECGKVEGCSNRVRMTLAEYAKVRLQMDRFAVVPGHETEAIEVVVARHDRFFIVDKLDDYEPFVGGDGPSGSGAQP